MKHAPFDEICDYRGLEGLAGEFDKVDDETGTSVKVQFAENHRFEFEQPDGTVDTVTLRANKVDEVTDFDVDSLKRGDRVRLVGMVGISTDQNGKARGLYVKPVSIEKAGAVAKAA